MATSQEAFVRRHLINIFRGEGYSESQIELGVTKAIEAYRSGICHGNGKLINACREHAYKFMGKAQAKKPRKGAVTR